jgi:transcriptional regulator with XRE-family HTH domain
MHCRSRAVSPTILPKYATEAEHDGRKYSFSVPDLEVLQCTQCGAIALNDAAIERIEDAMRIEAGLLLPAEIRRKRGLLGLNQQEMADYLRISMHTLSRWETGAQIQPRAMDLYLRLFFEVAEARQFLGLGEVAADSRRSTEEFLRDFEDEIDTSSSVGDPRDVCISEPMGHPGEFPAGLASSQGRESTKTIGLRLAA